MRSYPSKSSKKSDKKLIVRPREAGELLDCGQSYLYELLHDGELDSFVDGGARKITVESIRRYIERKLAASKKQDQARTPPPGRKAATATGTTATT